MSALINTHKAGESSSPALVNTHKASNAAVWIQVADFLDAQFLALFGLRRVSPASSSPASASGRAYPVSHKR